MMTLEAFRKKNGLSPAGAKYHVINKKTGSNMSLEDIRLMFPASCCPENIRLFLLMPVRTYFKAMQIYYNGSYAGRQYIKNVEERIMTYSSADEDYIYDFRPGAYHKANEDAVIGQLLFIAVKMLDYDEKYSSHPKKKVTDTGAYIVFHLMAMPFIKYGRLEQNKRPIMCSYTGSGARYDIIKRKQRIIAGISKILYDIAYFLREVPVLICYAVRLLSDRSSRR